MLIQITTNNFKGFKDGFTLCTLTDEYTHHASHLLEGKYLKNMLIFGSHQSGKSTILSVFNLLRKASGYNGKKFILKDVYKKYSNDQTKPVVIEITLKKNDQYHVYGLIFNSEHILDEYILQDIDPNIDMKELFHMKYEVHEKEPLLNRYVIKQNNDLYEGKYYDGTALRALSYNDGFEGATLQILNSIGNDIIFNKRSNNERYRILNTNTKMRESISYTLHYMFNNIRDIIPRDGDVDVVYCNGRFNCKISGCETIKRIVDLLISFHYLLMKNKIVVIDDLGEGLQPKLVYDMLACFIWQAEGQLIATTNHTNLLNLNLLRFDELWVIKHPVSVGNSELVNLTHFRGLIKDDHIAKITDSSNTINLEKLYIDGFFGHTDHTVFTNVNDL